MLVAGVLLSASVLVQHQRLADEVDSLEAAVRRLSRQSTPRPMAALSRDALADEVRRVNQAAAQLTIPWDELFAGIEAAQDREVALLSLNPDFTKREIRMAGEAADFQVLRRFSEKLAQGGVVSEVRLLSHEVVPGPTGQVLRFELSAVWRIRT